jgi:hypothetical protein
MVGFDIETLQALNTCGTYSVVFPVIRTYCITSNGVRTLLISSDVLVDKMETSHSPSTHFPANLILEAVLCKVRLVICNIHGVSPLNSQRHRQYVKETR